MTAATRLVLVFALACAGVTAWAALEAHWAGVGLMVARP